MRRYILTITCPDRVGIVAAVSGMIAKHGGWVLEAAQHGDLSTGKFFLRIEVIAESLRFGPDDFKQYFAPIADEFSMQWHLSDTNVRKKVVILVSKEDHCLVDLLYRSRSSDIECDVVSVISNHEDLRKVVEGFGIEYNYIPVEQDNHREAFELMDDLFEKSSADVMVLARYMQVLPSELCEKYPGRIINIHHSFLPSFAGARPYHQAFERGVKLIGATCHYVTAELDSGPIIEQDTRRIDHSDAPEELVRVGKEIERSVLARGLRWHIQDRVLLNDGRTVVFT